MDEIRKKDVLRLFFGKDHKHYLVVKVGKQSIKLKTEQGLDMTLPHKEGKLETLGDATITGFEVLRDPKRYNHYTVGAEVAVRTHDGNSFKGDVLENADGLLKIKTDSGNELYVDLDANDKVELIGNSVMDEAEEVKLPDEVDDLFFLNVQKESKAKFNRVYEAYRTPSVKAPIPFWVVPILDQDKCKINIYKTDELNEEGLDHFLRTTSGKALGERVEAVLFNQTVFGDRVKATYVYSAAANEKLPVAEYALMVPIAAHIKCNFLNPHLGERLTQPTSEIKRFDTLKDAVAAFVPNMASSNSAFDAQIQLYPLPLTPEQLGRIVVSKKQKNVKDVLPKPALKKSRSSLAKAYEGRITDGLTPSETLARIFALDYGMSYFSKTPSFRITHEKGWALETLGQRVKASPNPNSAYAKEAVAIINELYTLFCETRYADVLRLIQEYGRVATPEENSDYLYFSTPVFSKYKLISCSAEHVARMGHFRGKTGLDTALHHFVAEDGLLLDRSTGLVYSPLEHTKIADANGCTESQDVSCFLQTVPAYSEEDLIVLNLAQRLARELNLRISPENEAKLLDAVRLEGKDTYRSACTVAAFLAHYGKVNVGVAAGALRKVAKKKMWAPVQESKELTADVTKAAAKLVVPNKDKDKNKEKEKQKQNVGNVNSNPPPVVPTFERITPSHDSKLRAASETSWTVLAAVQPKEYAYLADVFAPDLSPAAVLARCMPVVMETVAPSEKSFFAHLGEGGLRGLYEFVSNLTCVVPTLLITGRRDFDEHILPVNHTKSKKKNSSYIVKTVSFVVDYTIYYDGVIAMDISKTSHDVAARFALAYKQKAPTFQRLVAVAKTALFKKDQEMLQACAVRAGYLHLSDDMSDEMQAYIAQMIRACVEMYRKTLAK